MCVDNSTIARKLKWRYSLRFDYCMWENPGRIGTQGAISSHRLGYVSHCNRLQEKGIQFDELEAQQFFKQHLFIRTDEY